MTVAVAAPVAWTDRVTWDRFVHESPTGSVFCRSGFLDALDLPWEVRRVGESPSRAAAILFRGDDGEAARAPLPFTMYQGLVLDPALGGLSPHRRTHAVLDQTTALLAGLEDAKRISFCLHPDFPDLRAFSWFHYHEAAGGRFAIDLRYTGIVPLDRIQGLDGFLAGARSVRRQEYRKAKAELEVRPSTDVDLLDRLHDLTFARQGLARPDRERRLLRAIATRALAEDFGELLVATDRAGRPAAATLFLFDRTAGYYLVAANDPDFRAAGASTLMFVSGVERCLARGVEHVDVVGMNSPSRGDFKASFGAVPKPYFVVTWERP